MFNYWLDEQEHDARIVWLAIRDYIRQGITFTSFTYKRDGDYVVMQGDATMPTTGTRFVYAEKVRRIP